jgi:hypothetical protein
VSIERNVMISHSEIESLDSALAWVVQQVDGEFKGASMLNISIEQLLRSEVGDQEWHPVWTAAVRGLVSEEPSQPRRAD